MRLKQFQRFSPRAMAAVKASTGIGLLALLMLTPLRHGLESSMSLHMLVQFPALLLAGAIFGAARHIFPIHIRERLSAWNMFGISGLVMCALVLTVLMIPRVLDLALVDLRVEAAKVVSLFVVGAVLGPSWRSAGLIVQSFFLGNILPMMFIVGTLYRDSPQRLCNVYRLDEQQDLGLALLWISSAVAAAWFVSVFRKLGMNRDITVTSLR